MNTHTRSTARRTSAELLDDLKCVLGGSPQSKDCGLMDIITTEKIASNEFLKKFSEKVKVLAVDAHNADVDACGIYAEALTEHVDAIVMETKIVAEKMSAAKVFRAGDVKGSKLLDIMTSKPGIALLQSWCEFQKGMKHGRKIWEKLELSETRKDIEEKMVRALEDDKLAPVREIVGNLTSWPLHGVMKHSPNRLSKFIVLSESGKMPNSEIKF